MLIGKSNLVIHTSNVSFAELTSKSLVNQSDHYIGHCKCVHRVLGLNFNSSSVQYCLECAGWGGSEQVEFLQCSFHL